MRAGAGAGGVLGVRFERVRDGAVEPSYQSGGAAGMDLVACLEDGAVSVGGGAGALVPTGWRVAIPEGYEGQVRPRSGLAVRHGITLPNAPGTIDWDYRGELMVPLWNLGRESFEVEHGMRIAQLVIVRVERAAVEVVRGLDETARGAGGFGSTGVR